MRPLLLIDDDASSLKLLKDFLSIKNYFVVTASNPREAMALLPEALPPLIITDIEMPYMDGLEFIALLRSMDYQGAIIALSGNCEKLDLAVALGANARVLKPVNLAKMLELVDRYAAIAAPSS